MIHISDIEGQLLRTFNHGDIEYVSIGKLNDSLLIASLGNCFFESGIQIWNFDSGVLLKEITECDLIGPCSFGFLIRPNDEKNPFILHAFDLQANLIGVISSETISSERVDKITHFGNDLYSFAFNNGLKLIECNIN